MYSYDLSFFPQCVYLIDLLLGVSSSFVGFLDIPGSQKWVCVCGVCLCHFFMLVLIVAGGGIRGCTFVCSEQG